MPSIKRLLASAALMALASTTAQANDNYPSKPISIVIPYGAGGGTDFFARSVAPKMSEYLGQTVVIENKPGAATAIAAADVARAKPDGYRILLGDVATFSTNKFLYKNLPYDADKDFVPITLAGRSPFFLLVNPEKYPHASMEEFIATLKSSPAGTLSYGSAGNGNLMHLTAVMLTQAAKLDMIHVPYKGSAPAIPDMLSGRIDMIFMDYAPAKAQIDGKKLKALATTSPKAISVLPDIPPVAQEYPEFEAWFWIAFAAPTGTPDHVLDKFRAAYSAAIDDPTTRERLEQAGITPFRTSGAEMMAYARSEADRYGKIIQEAGISLD